MRRYNSHPARAIRLELKDYRALSEFRHRVRGFITFSEAAARRHGIHPQQHRLLLAVKGMPEGMAPNIGNVARRLQIAHHSAVELVDRAAESRLVVRKHEADDRRVVRIVITPRGEALLNLLSVQNREELRSAAPALVKALRALAGTKRKRVVQ